MNSRTKELKVKLLEQESVEDRLGVLKRTYENCTAVILAPGPSLNEHDLSILYNRDDIVLLSVKQAYDKIKGQTDFHIVNTYNFDKVLGYDYENLDCIIFYGLSQSYVEAQTQKLLYKPHPVDLWVPVVNPPTITYEDCIHKSSDYDKFFMLSNEPKTWWGTSIVYEQAIPMSLLLGCSRIVTIGWDIGTGKHSYTSSEVNFVPNSNEEDVQRTQDCIDTTSDLYDWFTKNKLKLEICSDTNPADKRFNRIELGKI